MSEDWKKRYIRHVVSETGTSLSAIAAKAGVSSTTLTRPMNNRDHKSSIKIETLDAIRRSTQIDYGPFMENAGNTPIANGPEGQLIPVYDVQASAGFGSLVDYEEQTHSLAFPPDYLKRLTAGSAKDLVIISTKGDSMEPTLLDDDIVLVDMSKTHMGYEGMFVLRHNDTLLVKRAGMAAQDGFVNLISDNKAYPPILAQLKDLTVVGKVLWYGRKV